MVGQLDESPLIPGQCPPVGGVDPEPVELDALGVGELGVELELDVPEDPYPEVLVDPELVDAEFWVLDVDEVAA